MSKVSLYNIKTGKTTKVTLPKEFSAKENKALLAQALHVYRANSHTGSSRVKSRGEVARTTAKWFRQKGTGHARHGARSAPIFVGGGVAHGPKGTSVSLTLPSKMRKKARDVALSMKAKNENVMVVDGLSTLKNTKSAKNGEVTFFVPVTLTKTDIKRLVAETFGVKVKKVRTINYKGGMKRAFNGKAKTIRPRKKAVVKLADGEKIAMFGMEEKKGKKKK